MANKVEICGVNTSKLPVLTNEEMRELFKKEPEISPELKALASRLMLSHNKNDI